MFFLFIHFSFLRLSDIRELAIGVIITLKHQSNSRLQKDSVIGHAFISADSLVQTGQCDGWLPIMKGSFSGKPDKSSPEKSGDPQKPELKVNIQHLTSEVMPLDRYKELADVSFSLFTSVSFPCSSSVT